MSLNTSLVPTYIREFSPKELIGTLGSLNQLSISFGVFCSYLFGFLLPTTKAIMADKNYNDEIYWRICVGIPIATSALRYLLLTFVFTGEIPKIMIE